MDSYLLQEYASSESASKQQVQITIAQATHKQILHIIHEKDATIQSFSQQITRLKAEDIKSKKLISSLQEKIQKHLSSGTNTSSTFMIASQFKSLLTTFMTNTIPGVFYDFVDHPIIYAKLVKKIMLQVYCKIQLILQGKLRQIADLLAVQGKSKVSNTSDMQRKYQQLRVCLLNYFQNNYKQIIQCDFNSDKHQSNYSLISIDLLGDQNIVDGDDDDDEINDKISALNSQQVQSSEEMSQFCQQLYRICVYMILQESKWEFVFDNEHHQVQSIKLKESNKEKFYFNKKDFTCVDGFAKEGNQVCYILKALRKKDNSDKQYHYHPNIKNFVLPANQNELSNRSFDFEVRINFLESQLTQQSVQNNQVVNSKTSKLFENQSINTNQNILTDRILQVSRKILKTQEGLEIQELSETQNSQIIDIYHGKLESKMKKTLQQNCIVNPTCNVEIKKNQADKENINLNIYNPHKSKAHQGESHTKKQKQSHNEKNSKKSKKQKNSSTIDLTNQKRKLSQKEPQFLREAFEDLSNNINSMKNYQLPLGNVPHGKGSHKKKGASSNKTVRKCSVGKIISQSIHMNGGNRVANREKVALSQHSTMLMKQPNPMKPPPLIRDNNNNNFIISNDPPAGRSHQNPSHIANHLYQKHNVRAKRSVKLCAKSIQQKLLLFNSNLVTVGNNHNGNQRQDRPLVVKEHKGLNNNGVDVGRLREKYLVG